ncbi:MAG: DUF1987 domain-containing protein [Bacteroidota bacterium]
MVLDANTGYFEFNGVSLAENVFTFYQPVVTWLEAYAGKPAANTEIVFSMEYFNTASSKMILDLLMILERVHQQGNGVKVVWKFEEDDSDMEWAGEEYAELVELPFEQVKLPAR